MIAVDLPKGLVYMNDSGPEFGQDMAVPIGNFLTAWQSNSFELTIVSEVVPV